MEKSNVINLLFAVLILLFMFGMYMVAIYYKLKANCEWLDKQHKKDVAFFEDQVSNLKDDLRCAVGDLGLYKGFVVNLRDHFSHCINNPGRFRRDVDQVIGDAHAYTDRIADWFEGRETKNRS